MKPSGTRIPFEFCALRYFLQWHQKEAPLYLAIKELDPDLQNIRKALRYFQVARNFEGLKKDERADLVRSALLMARRRSDLSAEQKVLALAQSFKEANFQHNISAASKLLWLSKRKPFIIFDSRAFTALKTEFGHKAQNKDYAAYCKSWRTAYKTHKNDIKIAVRRLPSIRSFLPASTPSDNKLLSIVTKPWFGERVFDTYLWELGGGD